MRILVIEDDETLGHALREFLSQQGYAVDWLQEGSRVVDTVVGQHYDLLLLDLNLPDKSGLDVLRELRAASETLPVLILTARDGVEDRVAGLDSGADDYVTKPFHMEELLARLRALLRRLAGQASAELRCGDLVLDTRHSRFSYDGQPVQLTSYEFRVLSYLMHHAGQVISRSQLSDHIYAQDQDRDSNTIDVFIGRLRKKIPAPIIETVRGQGYRLVPAE